MIALGIVPTWYLTCQEVHKQNSEMATILPSLFVQAVGGGGGGICIEAEVCMARV